MKTPRWIEIADAALRRILRGQTTNALDLAPAIAREMTLEERAEFRESAERCSQPDATRAAILREIPM